MKVRHQQVESWMLDMVRRRLKGFEYRGKLDRQHYSFSKTAVVSPFPIYHHLIFCYVRTGRKLQVRVGCSLLHEWQLRRNPGRITHQSGIVTCDLSGHSRFVRSKDRFEEELQDLLQTYLPEFTRRLLQDRELVRAVHTALSRQKLPKKYSSKFRSDIRLVVKQRGLHLEEEQKLKTEVLNRDEFDAFLADLIPENSERSEGSFSLNASKAASKLQRYQLSSPQNFVVHLIGGAVAGGASGVEVYVDSDDIVVDFDGDPLTESEMSDVLDSMFNPYATARMKEFAVALNAATSMTPLALFVQSWNGSRGFHLDLLKDKERKELDSCPFEDPSRVAHRISFRDRPSFRVARRFLNSLSQTHPEVDLIEERCRFAPIPVVALDKDRRRFPVEESTVYLRWEHPEHLLGDVGLSELPGLRETSECDFSILLLVGPEPEFHVAVNGVLYTPPPDAPKLPVWCLMVHNGLHRDLSYTGINNEAVWRKVPGQVEIALQKLFDFVHRHFPNAPEKQQPGLAEFMRKAYHYGFEKALEHPVFTTVEGELASAQDLARGSEVWYTSANWRYPLRSGDQVYVLQEQDLALLDKMSSGKLRVVEKDDDLKISQLYFSRKEEWMKLPEVQEFKLRNPFGPVYEMKHLNGQMGLQKNLAPARLDLFCQGRPLPSYICPDLPRGLRAVLNNNELEVTDDWQEVRIDGALEKVLETVEEELEKMYAALPSEARYTNHMLSYLNFRKRKGGAWKGILERLVFSMRDGSTRSWKELNQQYGLPGLSARWLRRFHLSSAQKRMLSNLVESSYTFKA